MARPERLTKIRQMGSEPGSDPICLILVNPSDQNPGWVDFEIPFDLGGNYTLDFPPNKMLLSLELPDGGLLWISNLDLVQYGQ